MFINKNSIIINGVNMGQYIVQAQYSYNKLWGPDSGRNLAGVQSGTLIGIFPKIILQFRALNQTELETIVPILDASNQTVTYYDPKEKASVTMTTYTGDYQYVNKDIVDSNTPNEGFQCSFIAVRKRS